MPIRKLESQFHVDRLRAEMEEAIEKKWAIKWEKIRNPRSVQQNKYYWALVTIYGIETGYTPDEVHTDMKRAYGLVYQKNGKHYTKSTKTLNTKEMTEYIDFIKDHAGKNGVRLPSADYLRQHWAAYQDYIEEHKTHIGVQNGDQ